MSLTKSFFCRLAAAKRQNISLRSGEVPSSHPFQTASKVQMGKEQLLVQDMRIEPLLAMVSYTVT
jgi:hypothetical protein